MKHYLCIHSLLSCAILMLATSAWAQTGSSEKVLEKTKKQIMKEYPRLLYSHGLGMKTVKPDPSKPAKQMLSHSQPMRVEGAGTLLWGNVERSTSWEADGYDIKGVYSFHAKEGTEILPVYESWYSANGGAAYFDGVYHYVNYEFEDSYVYTNYFEYTIDTSSKYWDYKDYQYYDNLDYAAQCVAYDTSNGLTYGFFYNSDATEVSFGTVTYGKNPLEKNVIAASSTDYVAMAISAEGKLYAVSLAGDLYEVNKNNGSTTLIGATGVVPSKLAQSAYIDTASGTMYWTAVDSNDKGSLYTVDTTTGQATKITDMPGNEEVTGLYVPAVDNGVPMPATDLVANFAQGSTKGTLSFTMPSTSVDGNAMDGELEYKVVAGFVDAASGVAAPGERVTTDEMSLYSSYIDFKVTVSNSHGSSDDAYLKNIWIGHDTPNPPAKAWFTVDEQQNYKATVCWNSVKSSVNGGYMDYDSIVYYVERMPGNVLVAEAIKDTTIVDYIPVDSILNNYYYKISARCGDDLSGATNTNSVVYGVAKEAPYVNDFSDEGESALFTVIDSNNDGNTWERKTVYNGRIGNVGQFTYGRYENDADDWLVSPRIHLKQGKLYKLVLHPFVSSSGLGDVFSVSYGTGDDPTAYDELIPTTEANYEYYDIWDQDIEDIPAVNKYFTVSADGNYRFGIHAESPAYGGYLSMKDFQLVEGPSLDVPDSVSCVKVSPATDGSLKATITFTTPSKNMRGDDITSLSSVEIMKGSIHVATIDNPDVGQELSYTDSEYAEQGVNTYTVSATNEFGTSLENSGSAFVGVDKPLSPTNVLLVNNGDNTATMQWTAPSATGVNGGYVDVDKLTYNVYSIIYDDEGNAYANPVQKGLEGTSAIVDLPDTDEQTGTMYLLTAESVAGESDYAFSNVLLTGKPFELPFHESFLNGELQNGPWFTTQSGSSTFAIYTGMSADDEDGIIMYRPNPGEEATLSSGMISMQGATSPTLSYATFDIPGWGTSYDVMLELESTDTVTLKSVDYSTMERQETGSWAYYTIDLSPYKDYSYVRLLFHAKIEETNSLFIVDDINVTATATGINGLHNNENQQADNATYSINGMKLGKAAKGIMIRNGKKYVVK